MQRIWVEFRWIQLIVDHPGNEISDAAAMRIRFKIARIHTEAVVLREATYWYGQKTGDGWAKAGRFLTGAGAVISMVCANQTAKTEVEPAVEFYLWHVLKRCDDNYDSAQDVGTAVQSTFACGFSGAVPLNLWSFFWNILSKFDGWSTSC